MGAKSKAKGNSGEREVSKILSETLGGSFVRSNSSGAFIGGKNAHRKEVLSDGQIRNTKGDINPPDDMTHLVVECKSYALFRYHQIFSECIVLDDWTEQARSTADENDFWVLVFKANRMPWCISFDGDLRHNFSLGNYAMYKNNVVTDLKIFLSDNAETVKGLARHGIKDRK